MQIQIPGRPTHPATEQRMRAVAYARAEWGDDWLLVRGLQPMTASRAAAPTTSEARLQWRFGHTRMAGQTAFTAKDPYDLVGAYVQIRLQPMDAPQAGHPDISIAQEAVWTGIITEKSIQPHGSDTQAPQGDQAITAWGLEHLLDRYPIYTARAAGTGDTARIIQTAPPLNAPAAMHGAGGVGNRSKYKRGDSYVFEAGSGVRWSAQDYIDYLMEYHQPEDVEFVFDDQTGVLDQYYPDTYEVEGRTPWQVLDHILPRQRGLVWWVEVAGEVVSLVVDTVFGEDVTVGEVTIPANSRRRDLDWSNDRYVQQPTITDIHTSRYDRIVVRGEPMVSCFSADFIGFELSRGWDNDDETAYDAATNEERGAEHMEHVFRRYRLTAGWEALVGSASPSVGDDGELDTGGQVLQYDRMGAPLLRWVPLPQFRDEGGDDPAEQRAPFAWARYDPDPDDGDIEERYIQLDAGYAHADEAKNLHPIGLQVRDRGRAFDLLAQPNHLLALGTIDPDDHEGDEDRELAEAPRIDYTTIGATVAVQLDQRISRVVDLGTASPSGAATLTLDVPGAEYWHVAPGTVVAVDGGELITWGSEYEAWAEGEGLEVAPDPPRDDRGRLEEVAALAQLWYGAPRRSVSFSVQRLTPRAPLGVYVRAAFSGTWDIGRVGTVVTSVRWDFAASTTSYETAYREIDLQRVVEFPGLSDVRSVARTIRTHSREIRALQQRTSNLPTRPVPGKGGVGGVRSVLLQAMEDMDADYDPADVENTTFEAKKVEADGTLGDVVEVVRPPGVRIIENQRGFLTASDDGEHVFSLDTTNIEVRTDDPASPVTGRMWIRSDLP